MNKLLRRVHFILDIAKGMAKKADKERGVYSISNYIVIP